MSGKTSFLHFVIDEDLLKRVDDFRFQHRFGARAETIKWLLDWALDQKPEPFNARPAAQPRVFGLVAQPPNKRMRRTPTKKRPDVSTAADSDTSSPILVSIEEAGRILGFNRSTTYRKFANGDIPGLVRLGERAKRVNVDVLREWIFRQTRRHP